MKKIILHIVLIIVVLFGCHPNGKFTLNKEILASLGSKHKIEFGKLVDLYKDQIQKDSLNVEAYVGLAESEILLFAFGYIPRKETIPVAEMAFQNAFNLDSTNSNVQKLEGILHFLNKEWTASEVAFKKSIATNPENLNARHWYSLYLTAMKKIDEAMEQSNTILEMDTNEDYLLGRGSLLYFQYRFEEMKPLMIKTIEKDPQAPWAYDWLGMAYNGLNEHEDAIKTYFKAFELSDGTVEVGGGLGHALANAGEIKLAKELADYYSLASKENYLPPVQRSFIHLGLEEYDMAIELLEQAYEEQSWFLLFMQIEHWYDPIRKDQRFIDILNKMEFPE